MALTKEDLSAISEIMDTKLKTELQPLKNDMQVLKSDMQELKKDVEVLKSDVEDLKNDMQVLQDKVQALQDDMQVLQDKVQVLQDDMQVLQDKVQVLQDDMQGVKDKLHLMKLYQENVITPRLDTIESCYTGTYHRYQNDAEKMENAFEDIDLLKKVVTEHSEKLQKLA